MTDECPSRASVSSNSTFVGRSLLRVAILKVLAEDTRRYYVNLRILPPSGGLTIGYSRSIEDHVAFGTVARTEASEASTSPEFRNSSFCFRLPSPLGRQHTPQAGPNAAAVLQAKLMAIPTVGMDPRFTSHGGLQHHETRATGMLAIQGDVATQLLNGNRVVQTINLMPEGTGSGILGPSASLRGTLQVELHLLDSDVAPPGHTGSVASSRASVYTAPYSPSTHPFLRQHSLGTPSPSHSGWPSRKCQLLLLVSRAENIPQVADKTGTKGSPSLFVAAKTVRQAACRAAASSMTSQVERCCNPVWDEMLTLSYHESSMAKERVLLALVNRATSKLMYKCSIPVGELQPGRHYNICMLLGKARDRRPSMRHPRLYLTLYLVNHLTDEVTRWEALVSQAITRLQAAVDVSSLPLDPKHGLATVYKLVGDSSMAREPPTLSAGAARRIHAEFEADDEAGISGWIHDLRNPAGQGPGEVAEDAMPLLAATGNDLWPQQGAEALLVAGKATASSVDPALVLELHSIWKPAPDDRDTAGAMAGSSSKERQDEARGVANEQGSLSTPRKEQCMDPLEAIQDGRHAMEQEPHQRTPDQRTENDGEAAPETPTALYVAGGGADGPPVPTAEVAAAHDAALREARFGPLPGSRDAHLLESNNTLLGRIVIRLEDLPSERSGSLTSIPNVPILHFKGSSSAGDPTCTVHLKIWNAVSYLRHLKDAESPSASADPVAVTPIGASWMDTFLTGGEDLPSTPAQADASKAVHDLADDLMEKQHAMDVLQQQVERAESALEHAALRVTEMEKKNATLQHELTQLRLLLEEESKAVSQASIGREQVEQLPREELAAAAGEDEERRSREWEQQPRHHHGTAVGLQELSRRFAELQDAHAAQGQRLRELEREVVRVPQYKMAIKSQESMISRMEGMLDEALKDRQELQAVREQVIRLKAENTKLQGTGSLRRTQELHRDLEVAKAQADQAQKELQEITAERVDAMMRAEAAEARYAAASLELEESTRRYAREIASLKMRLAEKDAQLMGGFGSASNMALGARIMGGGGRSQMASPHSLASTGEDLPAAQTLPTFSGLPRLHPLEALGGPRSGSSALTSSPASPIGQHSKEHRLSSRKEPAGGSGMPDPHQAHDLGSSRADLAPDDHSQHPRHASPAQPLSVSNGSRDSLYAPLQARPSPRRSRQESPGQLDSTSNPALDDGPWSRESPGNPTASAAVDWLENVNNQWREMEAGSKPFRHPMITNDRQAGVAGSKGSRHSVRLPDRTDNVQPSMEDFAALSGRATRANKNREGHGDAVRDSDSPRSLRADSISGTQNGSELPGSGWSVSNQVPGGFGQQILEQQPGMEIINGRASTTSLLA